MVGLTKLHHCPTQSTFQSSRQGFTAVVAVPVPSVLHPTLISPTQMFNTSHDQIQGMENTFLRAMLNKTKKIRIRNTNLRLEIGLDETKNEIQKSRLRHLLRTREEGMPKKMLHTKMEGKRPRGRSRIKRIEYERIQK